MSPVERAKQINVYLVRMDLLRLLSVGVNLRIIFTGEKPRVAQHVGNRPRLLSVGETQSICGLRSCEQYDRWSSQARRKSPSAVEKNSVSGKTWCTVLCAVLISAAMDAREASAPGSELKWSGQRIQQPTGWNFQPALFASGSETGYENGTPGGMTLLTGPETHISREKDSLDGDDHSVGCLGAALATWHHGNIVRCGHGYHLAPLGRFGVRECLWVQYLQEQGTSPLHVHHQRSGQRTLEVWGEQGVIDCTGCSLGDMMDTTTRTRPHYDSPSTSQQIQGHLQQIGTSVKRPRDPGRLM